MSKKRGLEDRNKIVMENIGLAKDFARRMERGLSRKGNDSMDFDEILSYAYEGLIVAASDYDGRSSFGFYANMHMRNALRDGRYARTGESAETASVRGELSVRQDIFRMTYGHDPNLEERTELSRKAMTGTKRLDSSRMHCDFINDKIPKRYRIEVENRPSKKNGLGVLESAVREELRTAIIADIEDISDGLPERIPLRRFALYEYLIEGKSYAELSRIIGFSPQAINVSVRDKIKKGFQRTKELVGEEIFYAAVA